MKSMMICVGAVLLLGFLVVGPRSAVLGNEQKFVKVTNDPHNPVPVTVQGPVQLSPATVVGIDPRRNQVLLVNSPTQPLFVREVVTLAESPFQVQLEGQVDIPFSFYAPPDHGLLIEYVSFRAPDLKSLRWLLVQTTSGGIRVAHAVATPPLGFTSTYNFTSLSGAVRFYADAGSEVVLSAEGVSGSVGIATVSGLLR